MGSLSALIGRKAEAAVLANWPTEPILIPEGDREDPEYFDSLLTLQQVDEWIDLECLSRQYLAVVKDGHSIDPRAYATDGEKMPRRGTIRQYLNEGHTVSLRGLHERETGIAILCQDLARETGHLVHANAYLTPRRSAGLRYHYDPYVTLVVQLAGEKVWPIHPPVFENPMREYGDFMLTGFTNDYLQHLANTVPPIQYRLTPGDVLWLPRGYVHAPYVDGDESSLHLTVAIKQRTPYWVAQELVADVLKHALRDPEMRETVPPVALLADPEPAVEEMRRYLIGALAKMDVADAGKLIREAARRPE